HESTPPKPPAPNPPSRSPSPKTAAQYAQPTANTPSPNTPAPPHAADPPAPTPPTHRTTAPNAHTHSTATAYSPSASPSWEYPVLPVLLVGAGGCAGACFSWAPPRLGPWRASPGRVSRRPSGEPGAEADLTR